MKATTSTQDPGDQTATSLAPPDRVRIVTTLGVRGGKPRIDGHRITVGDVAVWHERMGMSPDEIVFNYPGITLSDVYAALAYYFENRDRIDADLLEGEKQVESLRAGQPSIFEKARLKMVADAQDDSLPPG